MDKDGARPRRYVLRGDHSERHATLVDLARRCADFDVRMERLDIGDYCIDGRVVIERKTYADFAMSLADGRLFPQAAALARSPHRPVVLLEGPKPAKMPDVHPHALKGAMISLAVMWRLPAPCTRRRGLAARLAFRRTSVAQLGSGGFAAVRPKTKAPCAAEALRPSGCASSWSGTGEPAAM